MALTAEMPDVLDDEKRLDEVEPEGDSDPEAAPEPEADPRPATPEPPKLNAMDDYEQRLDAATKYVAETALSQAKAEAFAKTAKAEAKLALETLQKIIDRGPDHYPLFDAKPAAEAEAAAEAAAETAEDDEADSEANEAAPEASDDAWRETEIGELDIPDGLLNKLIEAGIETIGALSDWSESGKRLVDIPGVGLAKADKIEEAMDKLWEQRAK